MIGMMKNRVLILIGLVVVVSFSSCGIFGKGCGCPTFGGIKITPGPSLRGTKQSLSYTDRFA